MSSPVVRAVLFDVFGTLVDWRESILTALETFGREKNITCDWAGLVDAWRAAYAPSMNRVRIRDRAWANLDSLHSESLVTIAKEFGIDPLTASDHQWIVRRWHELVPWSDVRTGLDELRSRFVVATLSNANVSLLVDLCRYADLRFDALFSAELFRHYKPDTEAYLGAVGLLGLEPNDVMMVAAHTYDLKAAAALGLRTAFIARPNEYGAGNDPIPTPEETAVDFVVNSVEELSRRLTMQ